MAIPWLVVLQSVPWAQVISNAPKVAEGARRLWSAVSRRPGGPAIAGAASGPAGAGEPAPLAALQDRVAALERATAELHEQMLASSELIKSLAEQNAQLIRGIEANRVRLRWLTGATVLLGAVAILALTRIALA